MHDSWRHLSFMPQAKMWVCMCELVCVCVCTSLTHICLYTHEPRVRSHQPAAAGTPSRPPASVTSLNLLWLTPLTNATSPPSSDSSAVSPDTAGESWEVPGLLLNPTSRPLTLEGRPPSDLFCCLRRGWSKGENLNISSSVANPATLLPVLLPDSKEWQIQTVVGDKNLKHVPTIKPWFPYLHANTHTQSVTVMLSDWHRGMFLLRLWNNDAVILHHSSTCPLPSSPLLHQSPSHLLAPLLPAS